MGSDDAERPDYSDAIAELSSDVFDALAHPYRRHVLYLLQARETATLETLAAAVTGWLDVREYPGIATADDAEAARVELHHCHLPKLAAAGLIAYDADAHRAEAVDLPSTVATLLDETSRLESDLARADGERGRSRTDRPVRERPAPERSGRGRPGATGGDGESALPDRVASLREAIRAVGGRATTVTVYAPDAPAGLGSQFTTRNVVIEHEPLETPLDDGLVIVTAGDEVLGATRLSALPIGDPAPTAPPWDASADRSAYREFLDLFAETPFSTDDRRELLATAREIEDRAWRTGAGTIHAGFQSLSAFRAQVPVYERLAKNAALDVHVYGRPDWTPPDLDGVTIHRPSADEIGAIWFVAFRDDERRNSCALLAEEWAPNRFHGVWTYDHAFVAGLDDYLTARYGGAAE